MRTMLWVASATPAVVICLLTAWMGAPVAAQKPVDDEGLLALRLRGDPRIEYRVDDFTVGTVTPAGLSPDCRILIFDDLSGVRVPDGTTELTEPVPLTPIKTTPLNQDGSLLLYLREGRYSVMERGCFLVQGPLFAVEQSVWDNPCCPRIEANPGFHTVKSVSGEDVYHVQTVDVRRGQTTRLSLVGRPAKTLSSFQIGAIVIGLIVAIVAFIVAPIVIVSVWWTKREQRRPVIAKELKLKGPQAPPATFEDVFGDAARAREHNVSRDRPSAGSADRDRPRDES